MARKSVDIDQYPMKDIFDGADRYIVPLFQREYKWTEEKGLMDFWDDLTQHYNSETERKTQYHFGPIMLINENEAVKDFRVVDGQQRLTTSLLLLIISMLILNLGILN